MANDFNREEVILFESVLERFESDNIVAREAAMFSQPAGEMQRRGDTVWRPSPQISTTVPGLDLTGQVKDVTGLAVPATLSRIESVPWEFDALEARDPYYRDEKARSGAQALSAVVNRAIADVVGLNGSLVVTTTGALNAYDQIGSAEALMIENDIGDNEKAMVLNARDWQGASGDLAARTLQPRSERALSQSALGPIAGFNTFRTSYTPTLGSQATAVTVSGAGQRYVPRSTSTAATGEVENVDNRYMNLTVSTTAGVNPGDAFTLGSDVNAVSHINKKDTGQLKTFRVVSVLDGSTLQITPPIIVGDGTSDAEDDYANVTKAPDNLDNLNWLNSSGGPTNVFWANNSIEIFSGNLAVDDMTGAGVSVMRQSTDSGVEILFMKGADVLTTKTTYRLTIFFGVTNLNPEMNGILMGNQT